MSRYELKVFGQIMKELAEGITVVIDYVRCESKQKYTKSKKTYFNTNFSAGEFEVTLEDRKIYHLSLVDLP